MLRCLLYRKTTRMTQSRKSQGCSRRSGPRSFVCRRRYSLPLSFLQACDSLGSCTYVQIMDLEARNGQLQEEVTHARANPSTVSGGIAGSARTSPDWLPRGSAKHTLTGHRLPITSVAFHPVFSSLVTASEDTTLKTWDWESGDYEQTLKGHTKPVADCAFDSKGNMLGKVHHLFVSLLR